LYFAENPEVAKQYADSLGNTFVGKQKAPAFNKIAEGPEEAAAFYARNTQFMPNNRAQGWDDAIKKAKQWSDDPKVVEILKKWKAEDAPVEFRSNLYKVDIADDAVKNFLDWDKPLSQQSESVRKAIEKTKKMLTPNQIEDWGGDISLLYGKDITPAEWLRTMASLGGRPDYGEQMLNKLGIKGIRYLDQGSRTAGKGTSNFVVFSDDIIKNLERNGEALK
jgi:hypothetical protein